MFLIYYFYIDHPKLYPNMQRVHRVAYCPTLTDSCLIRESLLQIIYSTIGGFVPAYQVPGDSCAVDVECTEEEHNKIQHLVNVVLPVIMNHCRDVTFTHLFLQRLYFGVRPPVLSLAKAG